MRFVAPEKGFAGGDERNIFQKEMVSIILPTYNEALNVRLIIPELKKVLDRAGIQGELLVIDDNSPDGTAEIAATFSGVCPVSVHVRKEQRGLSKAVIEGFRLARGDICVVMDADLSHPVDAIPSMVRPIFEGRCDVTVGTRYSSGGGSENWSWTRKLISRAAGLLARGLTSLSDPTSGFMAVRRSVLDGVILNPLGWKIVLETVVKANPRVIEVPIVFAERKQGKSKLGLRAQVDYVRHLWQLYCYRYPTLEQFGKFCLVGFSGLFVDTAVLVALVHWVLLDPRAATVFAFTTAVSWNYAFNRSWSFRQPESPRLFTSYVLFCLVCVIGLGIRVGVMHLLMEYAGMGKRPWYVLASFVGIALVTLFNFLGSKYVAFSNRA